MISSLILISASIVSFATDMKSVGNSRLAF